MSSRLRGLGTARFQKRFDHHDSVWISKIGLNYRFGGAPVMAKY